ncbi:MAG: tetratricopeptide repeat protein [Geobacter sp.]|nr:tetratricopeptide repeat protein [Geobacter sp.]
MYYLLADLNFSRGKYADAAEAYQRALALKKDDYEARVGLATSLVMEGEYKKSQELFAHLFRQNYEGKNTAIFLNILVALDRLEHLKINDSAELYLTLAYLNRYLRIIDARRQKHVISYADKALARDGKLDEAYLCKGVMYLKEAQYGEALAQFERAVEINPRNADAYNRMGYVQGVLGNPEQELASYKRAVEIENAEPLFAYKLGELLYKKYGDMRQASVYFKKAHDLNPADYQSMGRYGYTLMLSGEYDQAFDVCAEMINRYPDRPYPYKLKADCLMQMQKYQEAIEFYKKSHDAAVRSGEESELDSQAFTEMGEAYTKLKRTDEAITAYKQALRHKPHDVNALFNLQYLYRREGKYEEAYAAIKEILRLQPNHAGAQRLVSYMERNVAAGKSR